MDRPTLQTISSLPRIDFIGIGAARSGTSWIANILREHPQICISEPKEIRYFNRRALPVGPTKDKPNINFGKSLTWYLAHFNHATANQVCGEYSAVYFCDDNAPENIYRCFPDVRLIACLRNPIDRAYSHYCFHHGNRVHSIPTFESALETEKGYIEMGFYATALNRYLALFDARQILVVIFEDLIRSPKVEFQRLFEFLEVRPNIAIDLSGQQTNTVVRLRSRRLKDLGYWLSRRLADAGYSGALGRLRQLGAHRLWYTLISRPARYPPLPIGLRQELWRLFRNDVAELEALLGRDLEIWRTQPVRSIP